MILDTIHSVELSMATTVPDAAARDTITLGVAENSAELIPADMYTCCASVAMGSLEGYISMIASTLFTVSRNFTDWTSLG